MGMTFLPFRAFRLKSASLVTNYRKRCSCRMKFCIKKEKYTPEIVVRDIVRYSAGPLCFVLLNSDAYLG